MDKTLLIANAIGWGLLFSVWKRGDWLNLSIKAIMLALLVFNIVAAVQS